MTDLLILTDLSAQELTWLALIVVAAGIVRGFSGFALSAMVMATAVLFLPPVELIPICWWLEMTASILMARGGWRDADRGVVLGLVIGSAVGTPIGLVLTTSLPVETTKVIALIVIIALAVTQLAKTRFAFLATKPGLYISGLAAGIVTGLASVGGMVVALYVLSQDTAAVKMRAALVLFLFAASLTSMIALLAFGVMDGTATLRGLIMAPAVVIGVVIGQRLFTPRLSAYYRPFCLTLLTGLAMVGLVRVTMS